MIRSEWYGIIPILIIWKLLSMIPEKKLDDWKYRYLRNGGIIGTAWLFVEMAEYWWFY